MSTLTAEQLVALLARYVAETGAAIDLLLVDALALHAYGVSDRATRDIDGELQGPVGPLLEFLTAQNIPADLTQNFSGWSVVAMPPGYRDRATDLVRQERLRIRLLVPVDFVIAKLRRGTELDHDDAALVAARFTSSAATYAPPPMPRSRPLRRTRRSFSFRKRLNCSASISLREAVR